MPTFRSHLQLTGICHSHDPPPNGHLPNVILVVTGFFQLPLANTTCSIAQDQPPRSLLLGLDNIINIYLDTC
ncbi:hypothetical protein DSUL_100206 [Desulfovibrionales bacterium]